MKLKYYGTGAGYGIPEIFCDCRICRQAREEGGKNIRTRSCATLDGRIAIDLSVDTFYHSAFAGLDMRRIKQVLVTHAHHDHFFTNDMFSRARNMSEPVNFYLSEVSGKGVRKIVENNKKAFEEGKKDPEAWTKAEVKLNASGRVAKLTQNEKTLECRLCGVGYPARFDAIAYEGGLTCLKVTVSGKEKVRMAVACKLTDTEETYTMMPISKWSEMN